MSKNSRILVLILSLLFSASIFVFRDKLLFFQNWGYLGIFVLSAVSSATIVVPALPGSLAVFVGGSLFNPLLVGFFAAMGSTIGELTGYMVGLGGKEFVKEDKRVKKVQGWMDKRGLWVIFFLAAVPNPLFDVAGIISGASEIPIKKYLSVVFAGKLIKFTLLSLFGYGIL